MALTIRWSKRAERNFSNTLEYLENEFGENTTRVFAQKSYKLINSLSLNPNLGTLELAEKSIRGLLLSKHNKLFYKYTEKELIILNVFDTRKNPRSKKF